MIKFSKSIRVFINNEKIPFSLINRRNEVPNYLANAFEILEIVRLCRINLFIGYVFSHEV